MCSTFRIDFDWNFWSLACAQACVKIKTEYNNWKRASNNVKHAPMRTCDRNEIKEYSIQKSNNGKIVGIYVLETDEIKLDGNCRKQPKNL